MTRVAGSTRLTAVIGWPVEHSRSPQMLNAAFEAAGLDVVMVPLGVPPEQLAVAVAGLRVSRALGASVTIPHKIAVVALCDEVRPEAQVIGAVNCIQFVGDRVVGHNTDASGFVDGLGAAGFGLDTKRRVILLGAGGAARAVAYGLRDHAVEVIARRPVAWTAAQPWVPEVLAAAFATADLVVDCTPIGLGGPDEATLCDSLPIEALRGEAWLATLVYHRSTILLQRARARGHSTVDGRPMLVHQGARAFAIWTGLAAPVEAMRHALDAALS